MSDNPILEISKFFKSIEYYRLKNIVGLGLDYIMKQAQMEVKKQLV